MAKPRKQQVRNLKTEFKPHPIGVAGISFGGSSSQTISNPQLSNFLSGSSITGVLGGSDQDCPAFLYGGSGPWVVPASASFNLQIPGLPNGQPVQITIQPSDLVRSGGVLVLTTGKLAERINTTLGFPAYSSNGCALVEDGRIVIQSKSTSSTFYGSEAFVTVSTITSGLLSTLGFTSSATITEFGKDASTRGVLTDSADRKGGYVQLRDYRSQSNAYPISGVYRSSPSTASGYEPEDEQISPVYARLSRARSSGSESMRLSYVQMAKSRPSIDFTLLNPGVIGTLDNITFRVLDDNGGESYSFPIAASSDTNRTFQDLVDEINSFGYGPVQIQIPCRAPFISDGVSARLTLNGNSPISISIPAGQVLKSSELASLINSAISSAGQSSQGSCISNDALGYCTLTSNVSGTAGSVGVEIINNSPDFFGLPPGIYRGNDLVELVGGDVLRFKGPNRFGRIEITADTPEAVTNGFTTNGSSTSTKYSELSECPTTPGVVQVMIPEVMEFWEVPDSNEQDEAKFSSYSSGSVIPDVASSMISSGNSLIGKDGKLRTDAMPAKYEVIRASSLKLDESPSGTWVVSPKILARTGSGDSKNLITTLMPSSQTSSTAFPIRVFAGENSLFYTVNLTRDSHLNTNWKLDSTSNAGYFLEFKNGAISTGRIAPTASTFPESSWSKSLATDDSFESAGTVTIGSRSNTLSSESPRLSIPRRNATTGATPSGNNRFTLLMESSTNGSGAALPLRIYLTTSINSLTEEANAFMFVVNAKWNQTTGLWTRDLNTERSVAWMMGSQAVTGGNQKSGIYVYNMNADYWTSWTKVGEFSNTWNGTSHQGLVKFGTDPLHIVKAETVAKAWGVISCSSSPLVSSNYNISGVTRAATGQYNITFTDPVSVSGTISVTQRIFNPLTSAFVNVAGNITSTTTAAIYAASSSSTSTPATLVDDFQVSVVVLGA